MKISKTELLALGLLPVAAAAGNGGERPNVIVILADDLGYGDVGYCSGTISTPNIDMLARNGGLFTDGHATSATSTPSRYGLFTGMYPWKNENAKILPGDAPLLIDPGQFSLPSMFRDNGYTTAAIGKWHLGLGRGRIDWNRHITPGPKEIGFDYSCVIAATVDRVPTVYVENGNVVGRDPGDPIEVSYEHNFPGEPTAVDHPELMTKMRWSHGHQNSVINGIPRIGFMKGGKKARWEDSTMADFLLDKAMAFVEQNAGKPFFLYYGLHEPHVPRVPDSRFAGKSGLGPRGDVIMEADWCVGQLMRKLSDLGILENTLIIFSSDNGPVLDDGYEDGSRGTRSLHDPNGGLRGGKYSLFDAGTRVPFIIYWKGHVRPFVSDALVSQQDLPASLASLIGATVPEGLDSEDHLATFLGKSRKGRKDMVVEASGRVAYRYGSYALVPPYKGQRTNETGNELGVVDDYALYDLAAEKSQTTDISHRKPGLLKKMRKRFLRIVGSHYDAGTEQETLK